MEEAFFRTMLFDFYGELLTEKQRDWYDLHYNQDLSLQEIAEQYGATRQAVWSAIRRGEESLREFESKTGLVARAVKRRRCLDRLAALTERLAPGETRREIEETLQQLYD